MKTRTGRFLKLTIGVELKRRPARSVKIRGPCDDGRDFKPVVTKAHAILEDSQLPHEFAFKPLQRPFLLTYASVNNLRYYI